MKEDINEDLLIRYVLGEATIDQQQRVESWLQEDSGHIRRLEQTRFLLDNSKKLAQSSPLTETEAWERFKGKRDQERTGQKKTHPMRGPVNWLRVAAAALLFIGGGWIAYYLFSINKKTTSEWVSLQATNNVRIDTLPDGSVVHINKHSTLTYSADFKSNREVKLIGEAFFNVKHDETNPFTVQAEEVSVRDIGTAFNIKSRWHQIEVIVESGIVEVSKSKNTTRLNARQMVHIKSGDKEFKVEGNRDDLYNYYVNNTFTANNTPLWRLIAVLNEAYGANIRIENNALRNAPITAPIRLEDSLENILEVIRLTTPEMHIKRMGAAYIIK